MSPSFSKERKKKGEGERDRKRKRERGDRQRGESHVLFQISEQGFLPVALTRTFTAYSRYYLWLEERSIW